MVQEKSVRGESGLKRGSVGSISLKYMRDDSSCGKTYAVETETSVGEVVLMEWTFVRSKHYGAQICPAAYTK